MNAGAKFAIGAVLVVGAVGYLMASGVKQTGQFFLTPSELSQRVAADPSFYNLGMKVGARVVPGTVARDPAAQTLRFQITDGSARYPLVFPGLPPDTFPDIEDVDVEVRLLRDWHDDAAHVLAKGGYRHDTG